MAKKSSSNFLTAIVVVTLVIFAISLFSTYNLYNMFQEPKNVKIEMTYLFDIDCKDCIDLKPFFEQFSQIGINIEIKDADISSSQGKKIVKKYDVKAVPTIIFSKEISSNPQITKVWEQVGTVEKDGSYVLRELSPPYKELSTGNIKGLVDVTYLSDTICEKCYDVMFHKEILTQMGVKIVSEKTLDISSEEGKALVDKYSIKKVPTVILSEEAILYPSVKTSWNLIGTQEEDGVFIFRNIELLKDKVYHDLETGKIEAGKVE